MRCNKGGSEIRLVSIQWATESIDESKAEYDMVGSTISPSAETVVKYAPLAL
jgi:hypothetical protein